MASSPTSRRHLGQPLLGLLVLGSLGGDTLNGFGRPQVFGESPKNEAQLPALSTPTVRHTGWCGSLWAAFLVKNQDESPGRPLAGEISLAIGILLAIPRWCPMSRVRAANRWERCGERQANPRQATRTYQLRTTKESKFNSLGTMSFYHRFMGVGQSRHGRWSWRGAPMAVVTLRLPLFVL